MVDKIYVVSRVCYDDYWISAVFTDRAKADKYIEMHSTLNDDDEYDSYKLEVWDNYDNKCFDFFNLMTIRFGINDESIKFDFRRLLKDDYMYKYENSFYLDDINNNLDVELTRVLPDKYNQKEIEDKYTTVCQDVKAQVKYMLNEANYYNLLRKYNKTKNCDDYNEKSKVINYINDSCKFNDTVEVDIKDDEE